MSEDIKRIENIREEFAGIAKKLTELKITGITDGLIDDMVNHYIQLPEEVIFSKPAAMLTSIGCGTYDYDTWKWTPGNDSVYSFDVEVFNLATMYTNFLNGVAAIGNGELDFLNIREDTSGVNWEEGTGKRSVTFDWQGETYTINAESYNDWFDMEAVNQLNKIIMGKGGSRHLYVTGDGYQECILFYRDEEWAKEFREKTGLELEDK